MNNKYTYGDIVEYKYTNEYMRPSSCGTKLVSQTDKAILTGMIRHISLNGDYDISLRIPTVREPHVRDAYNIASW